MGKITILAIIATVIIMPLLIFVPMIAAWALLALGVFMISHVRIELIDIHFKHKNK